MPARTHRIAHNTQKEAQQQAPEGIHNRAQASNRAHASNFRLPAVPYPVKSAPPWPIYVNPTVQRCSQRKIGMNQGRDRNRIGLLELSSHICLYKHRIPTTPIGHKHSRSRPPSSQQAASLPSTRTRSSRCGLRYGSERALPPRPEWHKTYQHRINSASMSVHAQ